MVDQNSVSEWKGNVNENLNRISDCMNCDYKSEEDVNGKRM